jgi:hypothetical protein
VKLSLTAPTTRGTWTVRITNGGDVPVRLAADARVLTLDVTARGARAPVHCDLPEAMRPENGDLERPLVLPPGRSYSESFEARLYCFGAARGAALAPGSVVVAHLGWTGKRTTYFAVTPLEGVEPRVASVGALDAPPVVLPDETTVRSGIRSGVGSSGPTPEPASGGAPGGSDADAPMVLSSSGWVDAESESGVEIPVTLRNAGTSAVAVRFRPDVLRFDVVGPAGVRHCKWATLPGAPLRDQFTTLAPGASTTLVATVPSFCDAHTFDEPGVYFVRAGVDTRAPAGRLAGLHAFEGDRIADEVTVVRLNKGRSPRPAPPPKLDAR